MKLSKKITYALVALEELMRNSSRDRYIQAKEIAKRKHLPLSFLEQLLLCLKKYGFIEAFRGPKGGYFLKKKPSQILIGDVIRAIEGPIAFVGCLKKMYICQHISGCVTRKLGEKITHHITELLDSITLEDLCQK